MKCGFFGIPDLNLSTGNVLPINETVPVKNSETELLPRQQIDNKQNKWPKKKVLIKQVPEKQAVN